MSGAPAISVRGVSFAYSEAGPDVLRDVSLDIGGGTLCALLGPNGSGKTTLLNLILGWHKPWAGRVEIGGRPSGGLTRREMSRAVGFVAQEEPLGFELSVLEYVLLGRAPYLGFLEMPGPEDRAAAESALDTAGVRKFRGRTLPTLSSGEKQLASLARVLAQDPGVFLLDEPMSHLDLANTQRICWTLETLRDRGKTVVFTTHDPNVASASADVVVLLLKGRIVAAGSVRETLTADNIRAVYGVEAEILEGNGRPVVLTRLRRRMSQGE
jgi:iron complex transport system ATP-binding protein